MKSKHGDYFNHDNQADSYDNNVKNTDDPIRSGYGDLLDWIADQANQKPGKVILELGSGTGNLTSLLKSYKKLYCVDISDKMTEKAKEKNQFDKNIEFIQADLLEYITSTEQNFDLIVSSYAIHHLTEKEKDILFENIFSKLNKNGLAIFGDLMFKNKAEKNKILNNYRQNNFGQLADEINEEFFWDIARVTLVFEQLGFKVTTEQFSTLSWGLIARK